MAEIVPLVKKTKTVRYCRRIVMRDTVIGWPQQQSRDNGSNFAELNFLLNPDLFKAEVKRGGSGYIVTGVRDPAGRGHPYCELEIPDSNIKAIFWDSKEVESDK